MPSKPKRNVVYSVEGGEYSSYRVLALFSDKGIAEQVAKRVDEDVVTRIVYDEDPPRTMYYAIEQFPGRDVEEKEQLVEAWEGSPWMGRMTRGVAIQKWAYSGGRGSGTAIRVWGTDKEGVRRAWQELHQVAEAEEAEL